MPRQVAFCLLFLAAAAAAPAAISLPPGYTVSTFAQGPDLSFVTGLAFDAEGRVHVSEANLFAGTGRVLRVEDRDGDGRAETFTEYAAGFGLVTGIAFRGKGFSAAELGRDPGGRPWSDLERIRRGQFRGQRLELFVSHFVPGPGGGGTLSVVRDRDGDGVGEDVQAIVTGLPSDGDNGNQQIAIGPDGRLYFGQGARTNSGVPGPSPADGPLNAAILRVEPDGKGLEVYARGMRNVFDLAFTPEGELLATENGPDASGPAPVIGAPDELNAILPGMDYGWPRAFGMPPEGTGTLGPLVEFTPGSSSDGIALMTDERFCGFAGQLFIAQFGSFSDPTIGRQVVRVELLGRRGARVEPFATGFGRPLDVAVGPEGDLWVAEFSSAFFAPRTAALYRIRPSTPCRK